MDKFVTSIKKTQQKVWVKILQMNKKLIKKSWKIMKLYNKKRIMKIVLIIFKHLIKMLHLKFLPKAPKVIKLALLAARKLEAHDLTVLQTRI